MEISSRFEGTRLKPYSSEISPRQSMNFAAAVDDPNPFYFDDERDEGVVVPPLYAVAFTWPVIEKVWDYIDDDDFPREVLLTMVHYTERLLFHRPMRPGDILALNGSIASIRPHKSGTIATLVFEAIDPAGSPVFTEHIGALLRGVVCPDSSHNDQKAFQTGGTSDDGGIVWENTIRIDPMAPFIYDGCTNIHFPIHTSKNFARQVGLSEPIYQGSATLARAVKEIVDMEAHSDPRLLKEVSCRFSGMVVPGTEIGVRLISRGPSGELAFEVKNAAGKNAISNGYARLEIK